MCWWLGNEGHMSCELGGGGLGLGRGFTFSLKPLILFKKRCPKRRDIWHIWESSGKSLFGFLYIRVSKVKQCCGSRMATPYWVICHVISTNPIMAIFDYCIFNLFHILWGYKDNGHCHCFMTLALNKPKNMSIWNVTITTGWIYLGLMPPRVYWNIDLVVQWTQELRCTSSFSARCLVNPNCVHDHLPHNFRRF